MIDPIKARFIEEAEELIGDLEKAILALEHFPEDTDLVEKIFRIMHTLKGSGSMFGFELISKLTHELETIYDYIREGQAVVSKEILNVTLLAVDQIKLLLKCDDKLSNNELLTYNNLLQSVVSLIGVTTNSENKYDEQYSSVSDTSTAVHTYFVIFRPEAEILKKGTNPLYVIEDLCALGKNKVTAHLNNIPSIDHIVPDNCYVYWDIYIATDASEQAIRDVFMFFNDGNIEIHKVADTDLFGHEKFIQKINSINGDNVTVNELKEFISNLLQIIKTKSQAEEKTNQQIKENVSTSIRVTSDKLDHLMNLVSELITSQARLSFFAEKIDHPELVSISENNEKILRRLRDNAFSICLVPIETLTTRYKRLVRDLSAELQKEINFIIEGGDTELDKTIIENLTDPLLHILRNSIDHGIESTEQRLAAGKAEHGNIIFKAYYYGSSVHIEIKDDGAGIDSEKVRKKAIERGLISAEIQLTEKEIFDIIFMPGFSTADKVTGVSGRGVGMDVVKRKISDLRGELDIVSKLHHGTTITIKLPLTLSIIDGLLVKVGDTFFIIPLSVIDKCFTISTSAILATFNNHLLLDGKKTSFIYLREDFGIDDVAPEESRVITIFHEGEKVGLVVDSIVGENQAVLKPLGKFYKNMHSLAGATILGDGTLALVLDTNRFITQFFNKKSV